MTGVVLQGLVKRLDRVAVVDLDPAVPLEVAPGELMLVLGPSGSGKSTLARLIAGLDAPDEGEVRFGDRVLNGVPPEDRKVGVVFQDDALWPHLTVAENVGYGLRARGIGRRERRSRVEEALAAARLDGLGDRRPDSLSGLQRQRVALARALVVEPDLLLLDEPLGRLEGRVRAEFRDDIRRVHAESRATTLVFTHEPREALALADRIAVIDLGRIIQVGTPAEVYNHPANAFAAQFLGPVNLLQGQAESGDARGETVVRTSIGRLIGRAGAGPVPPGTPVTVAIRPESLGLGPTVPPGDNRFAATVERQVFLGEVRQVHLRGPNDWPIIALALQSRSQGLREGQSLTVSVPPESVVVLPSRFANMG
jgi:ABC-type Fe3+/spermidine/putrescine transport system ATPase subunit